MHTFTRNLAVGLATALILAAAVGTASARNLSVSNQSVRVVWNPLTFNTEAGIEVRCRVTLEGSFHARTIAKVAGTLVGLITRAIVGHPCERNRAWAYNGTERNEALGNAVLANSLPWHLTYEGFEGALPSITGVRLLLSGARFLLRANIGLGEALCNYTTGATHGGNATGIARLAAGVVTGLTAEPGRNITSESGFPCPSGRFEGTGTVTLLGTTNSISVSLI